MLRNIWAVAIVLGLIPALALAQPPAPAQYSPTFSPYLNLTRPNGSPALNYYGLVRPQIEARSTFQTLQNQIQSNQQNINGLQQQSTTGGAYAPMSPTGFVAGYQTYSPYFMNSGSGYGQRSGSSGGAGRFGGGGGGSFGGGGSIGTGYGSGSGGGALAGFQNQGTLGSAGVRSPANTGIRR